MMQVWTGKLSELQLPVQNQTWEGGRTERFIELRLVTAKN